MFLEIYDIQPLKSFFDLIYNSTTNVELRLDQEKLSISLLNKSHVCFYNAEFMKAFFGEYEVDGVEEVLLYTEDFYNVLKSARKDDVLTLNSNESYLICVFEHDGNRRVFELPLASDYYDSPAPPIVPYDDEFIVDLVDLKQPCIDLDKIIKTDKFTMVTKDNILTIVAPSDAMTRYVQEIRIDCNVEAHCTVNLDYILDLQKLSRINKEVVIKIGDRMPLTWIISSVDDLVKFSGLIAPIIEEDN